jgi:hypothetical protein
MDSLFVKQGFDLRKILSFVKMISGIDGQLKRSGKEALAG